MQKQPILLVLAAGRATRYGSLKQLEGFGPHGETIIAYAVHDAAKAGFGKVVFVIREAIAEEFKAVMLPQLPEGMEVAFVAQELDRLPTGVEVPAGRAKPWGTGHAVWVAASEIDAPFAVINGDDFYGASSFALAADFLQQNTDARTYGLVGFQLGNTLSEHGPVSRAICELDAASYLLRLTERTHISRYGETITAQTPEAGPIQLSGAELVSMNLMAFKPSVFPYFEASFREFLQQHGNDPQKEFFLPDVLNGLIRTGEARVQVLPSAEQWFGLTYPADRAEAADKLRHMISTGVYPQKLGSTTTTQTP